MSTQQNWQQIHPSFQNIPDDMSLQLEEISSLVGMHIESVRRWCRSGKLKSYKFGMKYTVKGSDFKDFMKRSLVKPSYQQMLEEIDE